jgi:methyltransferase family protein
VIVQPLHATRYAEWTGPEDGIADLFDASPGHPGTLLTTMIAVISILEDELWQMTIGERAALEGILSQLEPSLALEIGTATAGSLRRIAAHSQEVHSFDMALPPGAAQFDNVHFHTGDSHVLLRPWLEQIRAEGRRIDFALVDGDHSAEGVRADIRDILDSGVLTGIMLLHDPMNPVVRRGMKEAGLAGHSDVRYVDLDFIPGHLIRYRQGGDFFGQLWGGLGLVIVGGSADTKALRLFASRGSQQDAFYSAHALVRPTAEVIGLPARLVHFLRRWARIGLHGVRARRQKLTSHPGGG